MNDHLPNDSQQDVENETLAQRLESCGLPGFNRACRYAESQNLEASVHFEQVAPSLSRLSLSVRRQGDAKASTYQVLVEENKQRVIHEQYFAADQSTRHEETLPSAINEMVMDSRLEAFFSKAFNLLLPYLKDRHPPGF
ncbi:hypothetical protein [Halopseudomonas laoshanensis]|jgi:hypothetical protein|uniref:hypothetical protein n=1 Tax=Halopseudomonas TaxID=2901189 RepID=UPI0037359281